MVAWIVQVNEESANSRSYSVISEEMEQTISKLKQVICDMVSSGVTLLYSAESVSSLVEVCCNLQQPPSHSHVPLSSQKCTWWKTIDLVQ